MNQVKDYYSKDSILKLENAEKITVEMDRLKTLQTILSKEMPPERYNGIINVNYILLNHYSTSEEIESSLVMNVKNLNNLIELVAKNHLSISNFRIICMELTLQQRQEHHFSTNFQSQVHPTVQIAFENM